MSHDVVSPAYRTKLGNLTAKSVLVLLADAASPDGVCWPSVKRICESTEINKRTVLRMIQVFVRINLITKIDVEVKDELKPGFQINLEMLGVDLKEIFLSAYSAAQGDVSYGPEKCLTDADGDVLKTSDFISETRYSVSQTQPPNPLKGRTVREPKLVAKATVDPRYEPFLEDIDRYWKQLPNHNGKTLPMDGAGGRNLKQWLSANPKIDEATWWNWLENMFASENINPAWNVREIIAKIHLYADGPLNVFNRPMLNGTHK